MHACVRGCQPSNTVSNDIWHTRQKEIGSTYPPLVQAIVRVCAQEYVRACGRAARVRACVHTWMHMHVCACGQPAAIGLGALGPQLFDHPPHKRLVQAGTHTPSTQECHAWTHAHARTHTHMHEWNTHTCTDMRTGTVSLHACTHACMHARKHAQRYAHRPADGSWLDAAEAGAGNVRELEVGVRPNLPMANRNHPPKRSRSRLIIAEIWPRDAGRREN